MGREDEEQVTLHLLLGSVTVNVARFTDPRNLACPFWQYVPLWAMYRVAQALDKRLKGASDGE
jgi:hypothetical protein